MTLTPDSGVVDVWLADLSVRPDLADTLNRSLTEDELRRSERFRNCERRLRFILARGILREILSRYTGKPPAQIEIDYGPFGKPEIAPRSSLHFNVSHAGDLALIAVCSGCRVGIDVEEASRQTLEERDMGWFLSTAEMEELRACPSDERTVRMLEYWTQKEACLKADGAGFAIPPNDVRPLARLKSGSRVFSVGRSRYVARPLTLPDPVLNSSCVATAAVEGCDWRPHYHAWTPHHLSENQLAILPQSSRAI